MDSIVAVVINPQVLGPQRVSWTVEYLSYTHVVLYFMELATFSYPSALFICCVVMPYENATGNAIQSVFCQFKYLHYKKNVVFYRWFARNVGLHDMAMVWENWCLQNCGTRQICYTHRPIQETGKLVFYCIMKYISE